MRHFLSLAIAFCLLFAACSSSGSGSSTDPVLGSFSGTITFEAGGGALVLDSDVTATDADTLEFEGATLTISLGTTAQTDDELSIRNQGTGTGQIGVSGINVTFGSTTIGSFTGGTGNTDLVITLNTDATLTGITALLRNLQFENTGSSPDGTLRALTATFADGQGGSVTGALSIRVVPNVVGQPDTQTVLSTERGLDQPEGIAIGGGKMVVADTANHRVLVWNTVPTSSETPPDLVLGQPDLTSTTANQGGASQRTMNEPTGVWTDGTVLLVADSGNHRVLVWTTFPITTFSFAATVLGQPNTFSISANKGGSVQDNTMNAPRGVTMDSTGRIYVADTDNHRVLIWNTVPAAAAHGTSADVVLGQADFTSSSANGGGSVAATVMDTPYDVDVEGTQVFVADRGNHRILQWDSLPLTDQAAADIAIGQADLTSNTAGVTGSVLTSPTAVEAEGTRVYVADASHRVLIWTAVPTSDGEAAALVLGQPNSTSSTANSGGVAATTLSSPGAIAVSTVVTIADTGNHRILCWSPAPTTNQEAGDVYLGQPTATSNASDSGVTAEEVSKSFIGPVGMASDGTRLAVADSGNHRIAIWNTLPEDSYPDLDTALGQSDKTSTGANNGGVDGGSLSNPSGVAFTTTGLAVADTDNARVLLWSELPTVDGEAADLVLGQPNLTSNSSFTGAGGKGMVTPSAVHFDGTRLIVADAGHNRVMVWNTLPTTDHQTADVILGQPNVSASTANNPSLGNASMNGPTAVWSDGTRLIVADTDNNRVLVWTTFPTADGQAADLVLGQTNFTSNGNDNSSATASTLHGPSGVWTNGTALLVADGSNHRILMWSAFPTTNGEAADFVLAQDTFAAETGNRDGITNDALSGPRGLLQLGSRLFVSDFYNNRVLVIAN